MRKEFVKTGIDHGGQRSNNKQLIEIYQPHSTTSFLMQFKYGVQPTSTYPIRLEQVPHNEVGNDWMLVALKRHGVDLRYSTQRRQSGGQLVVIQLELAYK